ncbi:MAG: LD-carboxypeptidase [Bacteroidota bacterium]|nr:LD-carboxypeptidase [Bacteroidota bacterium]
MANTPTLPPPLQPGDTLAIVATARKVKPEEIQPCIDYYTAKGFKIILGEHLYNEHFQFADTDTERASDLQLMVDNPQVKAIICARGGYGTVRIIDKLNFDNYIQNPKWLIGFSDITIIHNHIHNLGSASVHGPMALNYTQNTESNFYIAQQNLEDIYHILIGQKISYTFPNHLYNKTGEAQGFLVGGNLSVLYSMSNTLTDINTDGKILFIEDLDEYLYHLDRMVQWLDRSGKLSNLKALIIGEMGQMKNLDPANPFGQTAEEIIYHTAKKYNYPICFGFPAGHGKVNAPFVLGAEVKISIGNEETIFEMV